MPFSPLFSKQEAERIFKMVKELVPLNDRVPRIGDSNSTASEFAEFECVSDNASIADSAHGEVDAKVEGWCLVHGYVAGDWAEPVFKKNIVFVWLL